MKSRLSSVLLLELTCLAFPALSHTQLKETVPGALNQYDRSKIEKTQRQFIQPSFRKFEDQDELQNIFKEAVILAYGGNLENFFNVLNFVSTISYPYLKYTGFNTLYGELESKNHGHTLQMMALSYRIKMAMSDENIDDQLFSYYNQLQRRIPENIRSIMFGEYLRLRNVDVNEYLYESNDRVDGHRLILTWVPGGPSTQDVFYFDVNVERNNQFHFIIRNDHFDKGSPMCQSSSYYTADRRKTVTCPNESISSGMKWYVEPVANTTYFKISNLDGTQLYSPVDQFRLDRDRRYVFTWQQLDWLGGRPGYWTVEDI